MAGEVKTSASSAAADAAVVNQRLNKAREAVNTPWEIQMMLEGRVFVAGTGIEEAGVAGIAALDDTTPVFGLVAPAGDVVIIPLWLRFYYDTEAGAAPADMHVAYVQADKSAYSAGTELPAINCLGGSNPRSAQGKLQHTLTSVTAITAAQNVVLTSRLHILDNLTSVEAATGKTALETFNDSTHEMNVKPPIPIGLYGGSALYFYAIDATARYNVSAGWIELPADVYKP